MSYQHRELAACRWDKLSFLEQMANIGSEAERAIAWQKKENPEYAQKAFERFLELIDLTLENNRDYARLKEIARLREAFTDYFLGINQFQSTESLWRSYFLHFAYACRKNH